MRRLLEIFHPLHFHSKKFSDPYERLYHSIYRRLLAPEMIEWFPTYLCNSHCLYCGGYDQKGISEFEGIVPLEVIFDIVRASAHQGTRIWNIGGRGGEPLLYPNLLAVLREIKKNGMQGILITNGLLLKEEMVKELFYIKWDILRISLDSSDADVHDSIRGVRGNFFIIDKALEILRESKRQEGSSFPYVICCPVITNRNYRHIEKYIDYCVAKGVEEIQFMPLIEVHDRAKELQLSDNQKREFVSLLSKVKSKSDIKHNIDFILSFYKESDANEKGDNLRNRGKDYIYCIHLWKTLVISEDGYISPCSLIKKRIVKIKGFSFKAWSSKEMNSLRKKVLKGELIDDACIECCGPLKEETQRFNNYLNRTLE
jgi:MoaA/NifB/PqqE/SkfB family radical SAM enzyme